MPTMQQVDIQIAKGSDANYFEAAKSFARVQKTTLDRLYGSWKHTSQHQIFDFHSHQFDSDAELKSVLDAKTDCMKSIEFFFSSGLKIVINRATQGPSDSLAFSCGGNIEVVAYAVAVGHVSDAFGRVDLATSYAAKLSDETAFITAERLSVLERLERVHANYLESMHQLSRDVEQRLVERVADLERQKEEYRAKVDGELKAKMSELDKRQEELEAIKKDLDDRESTHARRDNEKQWTKNLESKLNAFNLSRATSDKRKDVLWPTLCLIGLTVIGAVWFATTPITQPSLRDWVVISRQVVFTLLAVGAVTFLIRWQRNWSQKHADEEFRLRRMQLDVLRGAWLVEMAREWQPEDDREIPIELISRLGRNLFSEHGEPDSDMHPLETLMTALLGNAASMSFEAGGLKTAFDRRGLAKANKELKRKVKKDEAEKEHKE